MKTIEASKQRCMTPHVNKGYPILKYPYIVICKIGMCCNVLVLFTENLRLNDSTCFRKTYQVQLAVAYTKYAI